MAREVGQGGSELMAKQHEYKSHLTWKGNLSAGTSTYAGYGRDYTVSIEGKPDLRGSADPMFRGSAELHNPEDLFVAALSSCHMLSYLALCARQGVSVLTYEDNASGTLVFTADGGGRFEEVTLNPIVTIANSEKLALAESLHDDAHRLCYIASSSNTAVHHAAVVKVATESA